MELLHQEERGTPTKPKVPKDLVRASVERPAHPGGTRRGRRVRRVCDVEVVGGAVLLVHGHVGGRPEIRSTSDATAAEARLRQMPEPLVMYMTSWLYCSSVIGSAPWKGCSRLTQCSDGMRRARRRIHAACDG